MKKLLISLGLLAALLPQAAMAAEPTYPVYLDGQGKIGDAIMRDETTYLPMRQILEALGSTVEWNAESNTVYATEADGTVLEMPLEGEFSTLHFSETSRSTFYTADKHLELNGRVYLPVRFIADIMAYEVAWSGAERAVHIDYPKVTHEAADGSVYTLNLLNGQMVLSQNGEEKVLGVLDVISRRGFSQGDIYSLDVTLTDAGNYLVSGGGIYHGALTNRLKLCGWMPKDGGESYTTYNISVLNDLPEVLLTDGQVWLPGEGFVLRINEATGECTEYDIADIYGEEYSTNSCYWTDGHYMLLGDGAEFDVYDIENGMLINMQEELVTPELVAEINAFLQETDPDHFAFGKYGGRSYLEQYWEWFGYTMALLVLDAVPYMEFVKAEDGVLHFDLICCYYHQTDGAISMERKVYPLTWDIPE